MRIVLLTVASAAAALALVMPAAAAPGKVAVGVRAEASIERLAPRLARATSGLVARTLPKLGAVVLRVPDTEQATDRLSRLAAVEYVEPAEHARSLAFVPSDPLAADQWYLTHIRAFDAWPDPPTLEPVLVAVVDSGIDGGHPEFAGRIAEAKSFVDSPALEDAIGHGTMVAGEIAALIENAEGIAGAGLSVQLLIAKVVESDGTISLDAEAAAIRWAVDRGARVINLSLSGRRNPTDPAHDNFSELEAAAVAYARRKEVVVVAPTGNCEPMCPYRYASYPAALPHVIGVSAVNRESRVPRFSNRDPIFYDLAAPGVGILSTFPRTLSLLGCEPAGYTLCAPDEYRRGEGTSFSAALVSAAAATLLAIRPDLRPNQVSAILMGTAADAGKPGRDAASGNGVLDIAAAIEALSGLLLPADRHETNDGPGSDAYRLFFASRAATRKVVATLDRFNDPVDVYSVFLRRGQKLTVWFRGSTSGSVDLALWRPGTKSFDQAGPLRARRALVSRGRLAYRAPKRGWYFVEVRAKQGATGAYRIAVVRR